MRAGAAITFGRGCLSFEEALTQMWEKLVFMGTLRSQQFFSTCKRGCWISLAKGKRNIRKICSYRKLSKSIWAEVRHEPLSRHQILLLSLTGLLNYLQLVRLSICWHTSMSSFCITDARWPPLSTSPQKRGQSRCLHGPHSDCTDAGASVPKPYTFHSPNGFLYHKC